MLASYSVVGEREQGTLEPVLTTPIRREELLIGKGLAAFLPAIVVSYAVFGLFLAAAAAFAHPTIATATASSALTRPRSQRTGGGSKISDSIAG